MTARQTTPVDLNAPVSLADPYDSWGMLSVKRGRSVFQMVEKEKEK